MKHLRTCYLIALVGAIFAIALSPTARANTNTNPIFSFTATITLSGNDVCNGQCISTLNESFDFQWDNAPPPDPFGIPVTVNFGTISPISVTGSGPIQFGGFSGDNWLLDQFAYTAMGDGLPGDELDIFLVSWNNFVNVNTAPEFGAGLYRCGSPICLADFNTRGFPTCAYLCGGLSAVFTETGSSIQAPEPSSLSMLAAGLLAFLGAARRFSRVKFHAAAPF